MILSNFLILKFTLFILVILLFYQILKKSIFFKNIILIFFVFTLIIVGVTIYNFFLINFIIHLLHTTKSIKYDLKYKFIQIKKKHIQENISIFLLIIELIKIVSFGQIYIYIKKYNIFYLIFPGYFFILSKTIFLLLQIILNYPFNTTLNSYITTIINSLNEDWTHFKIEFFVNSISFNGKPRENPFSFIRKVYNDYVKSVLNTDNDTFDSLLEQQAQHLYNFSQSLREKVVNVLIYKDGTPVSLKYHPTILNTLTNYIVNITHNAHNPLIKKLGGIISVIINNHQNPNLLNPGIVSLFMNNQFTYIKKGEHPDGPALNLLMHFYAKSLPIPLAEKIECLDVKLLLEINEFVKILSHIARRENLLKQNLSDEELDQVCRIILVNKISYIFYKAMVTNQLLESLKWKEKDDNYD